jgi:SAM-dependent methyltransferase
MLTARTGLSERVSFQYGSGLDMPFPNARFDVVWLQHISMNIADKAKLYSEIHRVLRPAGRLAFHEVVAGPVQPIHFPVPWAPDPSISFLRPPEEIRTLLIDTGFKEVQWRDTSVASVTWFQQRIALQESGTPPLGLHLLLGPRLVDMFRNQLHNLQEHRVAIIQAVFERIA